jgi:hypothetical protein
MLPFYINKLVKILRKNEISCVMVAWPVGGKLSDV